MYLRVVHCIRASGPLCPVFLEADQHAAGYIQLTVSSAWRRLNNAFTARSEAQGLRQGLHSVDSLELCGGLRLPDNVQTPAQKPRFPLCGHADRRPDFTDQAVRRFTYGEEPQVIAQIPLVNGETIEIHGYATHWTQGRGRRRLDRRPRQPIHLLGTSQPGPQAHGRRMAWQLPPPLSRRDIRLLMPATLRAVFLRFEILRLGKSKHEAYRTKFRRRSGIDLPL